MTDLSTTADAPPTVATPDAPNDFQWGVSLYMQFDAKDPAGAVEQFLNAVLEFGLKGFCYAVRDRKTDDIFYVEDGVAYSNSEYAKMLDLEDELIAKRDRNAQQD